MSRGRTVHLEWGAASPVSIELADDAVVGEFRGPTGVRDEAAATTVLDSISAESDVPPLARHVVSGDRVTIAVSGEVVQERAVLAAVMEALARGGVAETDVTVMRSGDFTSAEDDRTGYLAADEAADPIHLARELIDADAVIVIGEWNWDASLAGRSIEGELWPAFSRRAARESLVGGLTTWPSMALDSWRSEVEQVTWQLGLLASLRLVPGSDDTLAAAVFGSPRESRRAARKAAAAWRPTAAAAVELCIASLREPPEAVGGQPGDVAFPPRALERLVRGVAAASRITSPEGTVCIASSLREPPGEVFRRWRQGGPLRGLVREAIDSGDPVLLADAFLARRFRRALGGRRLVLLSRLDQETVEELEFGHASSPQTVQRIATRAETVAVLHEADRMLPLIG